MKKLCLSFLLICCSFLIAFSQGTVTTVPTVLNADETGKITFTASSSSPLYNYTDDVYAHIGVVEGSDWMFVPAAWEVNLDKCRMVKDAANTWSITLSPDIRQWFGAEGSGIPIQKIGLVFRNSDGTKKGISTDTFISVTDNSFSIEPGDITFASQPSGTREGINMIDNSTVTFVLYDKSNTGKRKDYAYLIGDFNNWKIDNSYLMKRDDATGCWWYTVTGLDPQQEYAFQYYVGTQAEGASRIGDAYCEKILDPSNDQYIPASTYPDLKEYPVNKTAGIVSVFRINKETYNWKIPNFKGPEKEKLIIYELLIRDFSSTSDLHGVMEKLDYLQSLGINAIELMPCQEFSGNDSWGYNPIFYFAMDKAYGTSGMYKSFIDECHRRGIAVILDVVYNQADQSMPFVRLYFDGINPTADNPWFNVSAPHPYSVFYDFNHESSLTKAFVKRNLEFLLNEYKFDGFRFDLTKGFTNKQSTEGTASNYDQSRIDILKDYNATVKAVNPDAYVILEHFCATSEEKVLAEDGMLLWRNLNGAFGESAKGNAADFSGLYADGTSMPKSSLVSYMESHDEQRTAYYTGLSITPRLKQLACNAAFFLTVPGPKMIWQFGEYGYDISIDYNGRTGRKPLHWEYLDDSKRHDLFTAYSKILALRNSYPELFSSSASLEWKVGTGNWTNRYMKLTNGNNSVVIVGNLGKSSSNDSYSFPNTGIWYDYMDEGTLSITSSSQAVSLLAHTFKIYTNFKPEINTGLNDVLGGKATMSIYPNPVSDLLYIDVNEVKSVSVYSLSGMLLKQLEEQNEVTVGDLSPGTYLIQVTTQTGSERMKFIKR